MSICESWRTQLGEDLNILASEAHDGEFAAFISYALAFPRGFIALIDTYDVTRLERISNFELFASFFLVGKKKNDQIFCRSGILNFCAVAMSLHDMGYRPLVSDYLSKPLRLSGYLSFEIHALKLFLIREFGLTRVTWLTSPVL